MFKLKLFNQFLTPIGLSLLLSSSLLQAASQQQILEKLKLPDGFTVTLFADNVPHARTLALGNDGTIFVGSRNNGSIYALQDTDKDGKADQRYIIASGLNLPNGVAYKEGTLYVAEINRIIRFDNIEQQLKNPPKPVIVYDKFPNKKRHGWKYLRFGPDNRLYTAVGAPCNICDPEKKIFTTLVRLKPDGTKMEILARGIRNTVGFDWQPETNFLYFTENGRDHLGDDTPPDELNKWTHKGQHFGYPYCHGGDIPDPEYGQGKDCKAYTKPEWKFKAHMAPLGMRFYRGQQFPESYHQQLFVAQHGSWNRSTPHGYRIALLKFKQGKVVSEQIFAEGWLGKDGKAIGRPVDILELTDGSLLVSDDLAGVIYKITYTGN
ncbi:MAG: sorbosone dehydrogenase family protein [Methyloprofundus sp.]|nr:sorbosone dehydrogenase family protein [Methyloprofundus sp.]